ncbi:MAG: hypothetical protein R3C32_10730 [Chloroflexota bacterium]
MVSRGVLAPDQPVLEVLKARFRTPHPAPGRQPRPDGPGQPRVPRPPSRSGTSRRSPIRSSGCASTRRSRWPPRTACRSRCSRPSSSSSPLSSPSAATRSGRSAPPGRYQRGGRSRGAWAAPTSRSASRRRRRSRGACPRKADRILANGTLEETKAKVEEYLAEALKDHLDILPLLKRPLGRPEA